VDPHSSRAPGFSTIPVTVKPGAFDGLLRLRKSAGGQNPVQHLLVVTV